MSGASFASGTVGDDEVVVSMEDAWEPAALMIVPVNADVLVEYSFDDGATYEPADEGVAGVIDSVHTLLLAGGLTHVRLTRTAGTGTASLWAIC